MLNLKYKCNLEVKCLCFDEFSGKIIPNDVYVTCK